MKVNRLCLCNCIMQKSILICLWLVDWQKSIMIDITKINNNIEWGGENISRVLIMIFCWSLNNTGIGILFQFFINFLWWNIGYVLIALWLLHSSYSYFYLINIWLEVDYLNENTSEFNIEYTVTIYSIIIYEKWLYNY